jgi:hypothetical protein
VSLFFFFSSCTVEITDPLDNAYSGITETNQAGPDPIGAVDQNDWKIHINGKEAAMPGKIPLNVEFCAYPNPTDNYIRFQFALARTSSVTIFISDKPGSIIDTLVNETFSSGYRQITYDVRSLKSRIYRAFFLATDSNGTKYFSHGDFMRK